MKMQPSKAQWHVIFETLCDGEKEAALPLVYMKQFRDCVIMYFWLRRNKVCGKKLIELFQTYGNLGAVQYIRDRVDGRRYTAERMNASDLA